MSEVKQGDTVKVHYTGTLTDGTTFDSSEGRDPLEFSVGAGQMIPGFEKGVMGMAVGDTKKIEVPHVDAYGEKKDELKQTVAKDQLPGELTPEVGMTLVASDENGREMPVTIVEVEEAAVTIDLNHPLAGKDLTFEITLVDIY